MKTNLFLAAIIAVGASSAFAQSTDSAQHGTAIVGASASMVMTSGEVRKVDIEQGKITLKHDAITNLDMPAMTMVFRVQDPNGLKDLKAGDKVSFHAEASGGNIVVTHIQLAR